MATASDRLLAPLNRVIKGADGAVRLSMPGIGQKAIQLSPDSVTIADRAKS